jgi:GAF domain-containing protein
VLSERLAALDLATLDGPSLAAAIRDEVLRLAGAERAILWRYRSGLSRLFSEQAGEDLRAIAVTVPETQDILRKLSLWPPQVVGVRQRLVDASFGVASGEPTPTFAVPLRVGPAPVGVLLIRLRDWSRAGALPARIAPFAAQAAALLANHEALERARRNEAQLTALYQTSGEISSNLELETVLGAIVERARGLVGAPIAYIMLVKPGADEIGMRVSTGVTSPLFAAIRLRLGAGLGGMVAQEEQPFYTSDYLNDGRFSHQSMVDDLVRGEGIKSILGVPMKAFETFVGVLYVADRAIRSFSDADVDLLMSLADHAALAIENARLYERATRALAQFEDANRLVQLHNERLERAERVHRELSDVVLAGAGLPGVVAVMAELVGEPVAVLDEYHRVLAAAGEPSDPFGSRLAAEGLDDRLLADADLRAATTSVGEFAPTLVEPRLPYRSRARLVVPIVASAELLGSVWVETRVEVIDEERPLIEQAVRVVGLELLKERSIADAGRRLRRELLDDVLAARGTNDDTLVRRAADLGLDLRLPYRLVVAAVSGRAGSAAIARAKERLVTSLRTQPWCDFAGEAAGRVVALVRPDKPEPTAALRRLLSEFGGEAVHARAVASPPCARMQDYREHFVASERALQLLVSAAKPAELVVDLEETLVLTLLFRDGGEPELRAFADARLGPVLRQRPRQRDDVLRTLDAYLETGGSPKHAAAALHVHVNTVYYRLARLRALLGENFAAPRRALDLQVALLAYRLTHPDSGLERDSNPAAANSVRDAVDRPAPAHLSSLHH